jgi:Thioesterase-like superfamily
MAFYERRSESDLVATVHAQGPWDPSLQHAGPPAALLTRAVERCAGDSGLALARVTFEILGPIPIGPVRVEAGVIRPGRQVQLLEAELHCAGRLTIRARAWMVRPAPDDVRATGIEAAPGSPELTEWVVHPQWRCGFLEAMEWRLVRGGYGEPGPATVWVRPRHQLIEGEELSPAQRVVLTADSANGVSAELDIREWRFVPPELTVHLLRASRGEWICMDAATIQQPGAPGLTVARLYDREGLVGTSEQSLLIAHAPSV